MTAPRIYEPRPSMARFLAMPAIVLLACATDTEGAEPSTPEVAPLTDINDDPDVVEVKLVASEGGQRYLADGDAEIWGYRDGAVKDSEAAVPGPVLDLKQGQSVIVHFRNELPESTTIHWHGIRVPNDADGTPSVQVEVPAGGKFD